MNSLKRTNQGGSVVTFIVIAMILALAVVGTVYFVKHRGEQVRREQAIAQANKLTKEADAKKPVAKDTNTKSGGEAPSDKPTAVPVKPSPSVVTPAPSEQAALPTTGSGLDVVRLIAIGLLIASGSSYIASRRVLDRTL